MRSIWGGKGSCRGTEMAGEQFQGSRWLLSSQHPCDGMRKTQRPRVTPSPADPTGLNWVRVGKRVSSPQVPSTWAIPSLQPFPSEMSRGNKQRQCPQRLETTLHTEGQRRQTPCDWNGAGHLHGAGQDTFTAKQGKASRSSARCGPQLAIAIGMATLCVCRNGQGALPWWRKRGSSLPLSAEGCLAQGLMGEKAAKVFSAVFSLVAAAGGGLSSPRTCSVHEEVRKKQHRSNPCKLDIKNTSPILNADRVGNANIIKAR